MDARLPAQIEASALIRRAQAEGGFAVVVKKGHETAGTLLVVLTHNGANTRAYERMPQLDGTRAWTLSKTENPENKQDFADYLARRARQDDDLWIVELDVAQGERFIGLPGTLG